jgi:hypothetical protein
LLIASLSSLSFAFSAASSTERRSGAGARPGPAGGGARRDILADELSTPLATARPF